MSEFEAFYKMVKKWTVSDYRTQKIKAEVIIDMLISEHIEEIVTQSLGKDVKLIAKEFPIARIGQPCIQKKGNKSGNRQYASVDFLMCEKSDKPIIYLVELKTSDESVDGIQLWNMLWTCNQKASSLYNRFYDVIMNHGIDEHGNNLSTKKYQYTLSKYAVKHEKVLGDISKFGDKRLGEGAANIKSVQRKVAEEILDNGFYQDFNGAEMQILYVSLNTISKTKIIELANSTKKEIKKKIQNKNMDTEHKKAVISFIGRDISSFISEKHIFLSNLQGFDDKHGTWPLINQIIDDLQKDWPSWFNEQEIKGDKKFDEDTEKLYHLLRDTPKKKLPGLGDCPEYQELYDSAQGNEPDEYIWFAERLDIVVHYLAGSEDSQARFAGRNIDDIPELIMKEILTGKRQNFS